MRVALRKTINTNRGRGGSACVICALTDEQMQRVNAEVWDGAGKRTRGYRARGMRAYYSLTGRTIDPKTVTRHADHIEATWREVSPAAPATSQEVAVLPSDYKSIVDRMADLGVRAMVKLDERVRDGLLEDREMVMVAKAGVQARAQQEANRVAESRPQTQVALIFGLASGHLVGELPHEAIDVTPERELLDEVNAERMALAALASASGGSSTEDEFDFDAIV